MSSTGLEPQDVASREQPAAFIESMAADLSLSPGNWENRALPDFLEAMAAWVSSAHHLKNNVDIDVEQMSTWTFAAAMLSAAAIYE